MLQPLGTICPSWFISNEPVAIAHVHLPNGYLQALAALRAVNRVHVDVA